MARLHHILFAVALCASVGTASAGSLESKIRSLNPPTPGVKVTAQVAADQGLGTALLSAKVLYDGSLAGGAGATGASKLDTGAYQINFNRDVRSCIYTATSNGTTFITNIGPRSFQPNSIFAAVVDSSNNLQNDNFYVIVFCNK